MQNSWQFPARSNEHMWLTTQTWTVHMSRMWVESILFADLRMRAQLEHWALYVGGTWPGSSVIWVWLSTQRRDMLTMTCHSVWDRELEEGSTCGYSWTLSFENLVITVLKCIRKCQGESPSFEFQPLHEKQLDESFTYFYWLVLRTFDVYWLAL